MGGYRRVIDSCTNLDAINTDICCFQNILRKNDYNQHFINSLNDTLKNMIHNSNTSIKEKNLSEGPKINLKIPFHYQAIYDKLIHI